MAKSPDAFRTISEVSEWLDTPAHVLRFWESRFNQIKPVKRGGGRRYYRPNDMLLLGGIKRLLHDDGITIKGVQKILREKGVKYVSSLSIESPDQSREEHKSDIATAETTPIVEILKPETEIETPSVADEISAVNQPLTIESEIPETSTIPHSEAISPASSPQEDDTGQEDPPAKAAEDEPAVAASPWDDPAQSFSAARMRGRGAPSAPQTERSEVEKPAEKTAEPPTEPQAEELPSTTAQPMRFADSKIPVDAMAVAEIDEATSEQRIAALYQRLHALRDRVRADMLNV